MQEYVSIYSGWIVLAFIIGYLLVIFEHRCNINKSAAVLILAVVLWSLQIADRSVQEWGTARLLDHLSNVSQVVIFLLGALTIVETIYVHGGLQLISNVIRIRSKRKALWVISVVTFFLSSVLDNLTTTIVMVMLLRKLLSPSEDRLLFGGAVVIAANAGGAWTPIGDVTTTMLWVGGQLSSVETMRGLFLPSIACLCFSLLWFSFFVKGELHFSDKVKEMPVAPHGKLVLYAGVFFLMAVPVFKMITGLPPFMGMLFSMGALWILTDILHGKIRDREHLRVVAILPRVDLTGIFFFLGILLSVSALETAGILNVLAVWFDAYLPSKVVIAATIGVISAIIDNVPLVAACMGMYDLIAYPPDHYFWQLIAYCAGTGGSMLVIGSAAGVAFMNMEKVNFFWYLKRIAPPAALGYFAGILTYMACM